MCPKSMFVKAFSFLMVVSVVNIPKHFHVKKALHFGQRLCLLNEKEKRTTYLTGTALKRSTAEYAAELREFSIAGP